MLHYQDGRNKKEYDEYKVRISTSLSARSWFNFGNMHSIYTSIVR